MDHTIRKLLARRYSKILNFRWNLVNFSQKSFGSVRPLFIAVPQILPKFLTAAHCTTNEKKNFGENFKFYSTNNCKPDPLGEAAYEKVADETLDSLWDYFDHLSDKCGKINEDFDVQYAMGVLSVNLGKIEGRPGKQCIYVINKQTPNKQIWLSSPFTGPKRYDFSQGRWIYMHDGICLHDLLSQEIKNALKDDSVDFSNCTHAKL